MARQSLASRGHGNDENGNFVQIVHMVARHCPMLKEWLENKRLKPYSIRYLSSGSQNEIVRLLAEYVEERIKEEVKDAKMHSVSDDTTPDSASEDKTVVALRLVPPSGILKERVIDMKQCIDKREATAKGILSSLKENSIDVNALAFHAPLKQRIIRGNNKQHFNKDLRKAVILRATLKNRAQKSGKAEDYEKYKKQRT